MSVFGLRRNVLNYRSCLEYAFSINGFDKRYTSTKPSKITCDPALLNTAKPYKTIPKLPMLPLVGSAWTYFPRIGKWSPEELHIADIYKYETYGDIVREKFGRLEVVSCYHPEAMLMMEADDGFQSRGDFATLKAYRRKREQFYGAAGLLVAEGEQWKSSRITTETRILNLDNIKFLLEFASRVSEDFVQLIHQMKDSKDEVDDAISLLYRWALEGLAYVSLFERLGCLRTELTGAGSDGMKMIESIQTQLDCMNKLEASAGNFQLWQYVPTPTWRKFVKAADVFSSIAFKYIALSVYQNNVPPLTMFPSGFFTLNMQKAIPLVTDLMMAGINTTASAAAFLLYDLATNPEKQNQARAEVLKLLSDEWFNFDFQAYEQAHYLKSCLKESMRLHPVVRGHARKYDKDVVLRGYKIPAGTTIMCVLQVIYKNPKYFPSPNEYIPERWAGEQQDVAFFAPFGAGKRSCVGSMLAEVEILSLVAEVLRYYKVEYHHEPIGMHTKLINVPDRPMKLRFVEY